MRKANFPTDFLVSITICHFTLALITDIFLPDGNLPTYWVSIFCHSWIMTMSDNMSVNSFNILFFALDRLVTLCKILDPGRKLPLCYMWAKERQVQKIQVLWEKLPMIPEEMDTFGNADESFHSCSCSLKTDLEWLMTHVNKRSVAMCPTHTRRSYSWWDDKSQLGLIQCFLECGLRPEASVSPRNLLEMHIFRSHPVLLNQNLWRWAQRSVF